MSGQVGLSADALVATVIVEYPCVPEGRAITPFLTKSLPRCISATTFQPHENRRNSPTLSGLMIISFLHVAL